MSSALQQALLSFIWQGALIGVLLAVLQRFLSAPRIRYIAASIALLAMPVVFTISVVVTLESAPKSVPAPLWPVSRAILPLSTTSTLDTSQHSPFAPWLVPAWIVGVLLFYGYRLAGWIAVQRLR